MIGISGLGLIGGSLGLALRAAGLEVVGWDVADRACVRAQEMGCVDRIGSFQGCDIVFLAVPPDAVVEAYSQVPASVPVVTDTASVKGTVMSRIGDDRFVGGHPMAGKESGGLGAAEASLFLGAYWLLCPGGPSAVETLSSVVRSIGAKPLIMSAEEHDRHVALLSHLPHLLALHLLDLSGALPFPEVAAGSWRDLTRVAAADPALWIQILRANAPAVADAAETLGRRLQQDAGRLRAGDTGGLERLFEARDRRGGS